MERFEICAGASVVGDGYLWGLMLAGFEVGDLADRTAFCLTVSLTLEEGGESDDDELDKSEEDWLGAWTYFARKS